MLAYQYVKSWLVKKVGWTWFFYFPHVQSLLMKLGHLTDDLFYLTHTQWPETDDFMPRQRPYRQHHAGYSGKELHNGVSYGTSIDQSHRYGHPQAACREPAGSYDKTTRTAICFEHKTQYLLICAPYTRIVVFWHISNIPPMILQRQISCNTPTFI